MNRGRSGTRTWQHDPEADVRATKWKSWALKRSRVLALSSPALRGRGESKPQVKQPRAPPPIAGLAATVPEMNEYETSISPPDSFFPRLQEVQRRPSYCTREVNYARTLEPSALKDTRFALVEGSSLVPLRHEAVPRGDERALQEWCGVPVSRSALGGVTESGAHVSRIKSAPPDPSHLDLPSQSVRSHCW